MVTAQRIGQVISELKPKAENIKRIEAKYNPLNEKSVPRAALSLLQKGKDPKSVALSVAQIASKDLKDYVSDYVSGTLTALDAPNRAIIRPAWDNIKIKLAQDRNQDVDVAGVLQGSKTLSLPDILQIDPNSLDYQAYRFLDFAPELINVIPGTGTTTSLAKKVKLPQEGLFDEIAQDATEKFAKETGEALSKEVVDRAKEIAPTLQNLEQKAVPTQDLITEARKYKTPEEFINAKFEKDIQNYEFSTGGGALGQQYNGYIQILSKTPEPVPGTSFLEYKPMGIVEYSYFNGEISVLDIEIKPEFRKQGLGTILFKKLQTLSDKPISRQGNYSTKEGLKLRESFERNKEELKSLWNEAQKTTQKAGKLGPRKEITPAEIAVQGELGGVPPSGNIPLALPGGVPFQTKQRKFPTTVKEAKSTAKGVTKILEDRFDLYSPIKNATEYEKAVK
ncbi:MAG: hypothetical protein EBR82_53045, partial [Caulobacteraceae bacterium]|nr:hypothetical protein [Caulobacteraceae bacterium]